MKVKLVSNLSNGNTVTMEIDLEEGLALQIRPAGYGDHNSSDGFGVPIMLEVYEGRLRLLAWPDITKEDPTVIDMQGAREAARQKMKRVVKSKCLPYFRNDGLVSIFNEEGGEILVRKEDFEDVTTDGGRMVGLFKFEIWEDKT